METFFIDFEAKEQELYSFLLQHYPESYKSLLTHLKEKDKVGRPRNKSEILSKLRLKDGPKFWAKEIYDQNIEVDWKKEYDKKYNEYLKLRNDYLQSGFVLIDLVLNKSFRGFRKEPEVLEDMRQEGYFGLLRAFEMFDYKMGFKFPYYAQLGIKNSINKYLRRKRGMIRIPQQLFTNSNNELEGVIDSGVALNYYVINGKKYLRPFAINSIDFPYPHLNGNKVSGSKKTYEELIADESIKPLADQVWINEVNELVMKTLVTLPSKDADIILDYFGFYSPNEGVTLREIAEKYGITRQAIDKKQKRILKTLKKSLQREGFHESY